MRDYFHPYLAVLALLACADPPADSAGGTPDFNYIPINDDACFADTEEKKASAKAALDAIVSGDANADGFPDYAAWVVRDLELCEATATDSCSPCVENPLRDFLDAMDALQWQGEAGTAIAPARTVDYFRQALQYPAADLTVHLAPQDGGLAILTLGQASEVACVDCAAPVFDLEPETLSAGCASVTHGLVASGGPTSDGVVFQAAPGTQAFGFVVPLVDSFPDIDSFETVRDVQFWAQAQPGYTVVAQSPTPTLALATSPGTGCFSMELAVPIGNILSTMDESWQQQAWTIIEEGGFENPALSGTIRATLRGRLESAAMSVSPSLAPSAAGGE